jgi:glycosyltransferase involved in cell wall biosynthesis
MNKKIILIEPVIAHYRKDVYKGLFRSNCFDFRIIAGQNYEGIKGVETQNERLFNFIRFKIFNHKFYFLKGIIKYLLKEKPDIIICGGVDFHLIHTLIVYLIHRIILRKQFYWWSHATYGNQGSFGIFIRKIIYKSSTGIFSYNNKGKENLLSMGVKESRIQVVNNSINKEDYGYLNHDLYNRKPNQTFTILYTGRLTKAKKVDLLIKALALLKKNNSIEFKCFIIGDGDLDDLKHLASNLDVTDKIDFVGAKYGEEAHYYFLNSDIFVYPGGIGLSIIHAMSFGLPVITSNNYNEHGPEIEILQIDDNGDLFQDNSIEELADKILEWKNRLKKSKNEYVKNCIDRIEKMEYLPDVMSQKVIAFLERNNYIEVN